MLEVDKYTEIELSDYFLRRAIYDTFEGKCFYTGRDVSFDEMDIDHILPKSKGGANCIANYVLSCNYINNKKKASFYENLIKISIEVVNTLFADKVVDRYNSLRMNDLVLDEHIEINTFINDKLMIDKFIDNRLRSYVRQNLIPIKIFPITLRGKRGVKPKLFYNKKEIEILYHKWIVMQKDKK